MERPVLSSKRFEKIVLIDDDSVFCQIMASFAASRGIELDYFATLQDMGSLGKLSEYSVAIVDYDLGPMNGIEIAEYLPVFFGSMPMILVSGKHRKKDEGKPWPKCVREFIHKDDGPEAILNIAAGYLPRRLRRGEIKSTLMAG